MSSKLYKHQGLAAILVIALTILLVACNRNNNDPDTVAKGGLNSLKSLLNKGGASNLLVGKYSPSEVAASTLGNKIKVYYIPLDSVIAYHPNENTSVLYDAHQYIYPVLTKEIVSTSETVELNATNNKWEVAGFGDQTTIRLYVASSKANHFAASPYLVRIPSMSLSFIGGQLNNKPSVVYLSTPAQAFDSITPGNPMLLDDLLRQLKSKAQQMTLLP